MILELTVRECLRFQGFPENYYISREVTIEDAYKQIGNSKEYKFDAVAPGTYTMRVEKNNHVTREYEVVVDDANVTLDVKIHPLGDVTGDGKTNAKDWQRVYLHVNKTSPLY